MPSTTLSRDDVTRYASAAGFSGAALATAVDIAWAESGWNTRAHNGKPPDDSYGLWQINMIGSLGPARRREFGIATNSELYDPATNARAAYKVYRDAGNSFRPWTTYTSGRYVQAPDSGTSGTGTPSDGSSGPSVADSLNPLSGVNESISNATETLRRVSIIVLVVIIALVCIIIGILLINHKSVGTLTKAAVKIGSKGIV